LKKVGGDQRGNVAEKRPGRRKKRKLFDGGGGGLAIRVVKKGPAADMSQKKGRVIEKTKTRESI